MIWELPSFSLSPVPYALPITQSPGLPDCGPYSGPSPSLIFLRHRVHTFPVGAWNLIVPIQLPIPSKVRLLPRMLDWGGLYKATSTPRRYEQPVVFWAQKPRMAAYLLCLCLLFMNRLQRLTSSYRKL